MTTPALTLEQLLDPMTKDQFVQVMLDLYEDLGFNITAWQSGSEQRTMIEVMAQVFENLSKTQLDITKGGFNDTSTGEFLSVLSESHFDNERNAAVKTQGKVVLTADSAVGPYTIDTGANQIVVANADRSVTYRNITSGTLNGGSTLEVTVEAETAGASGDVASGEITEMVTPLAGVTVDNPTPSGAQSWITRNGADEESDDDLQERNRSKWPSLSQVTMPGKSYEYFAREAEASVTRPKINDSNPRGAGTVDLYLAGVTGPVGSAIVSSVDDYLRGVTDGWIRLSPSTDMLVKSAVQRTVTVTGTVYVLAAYNNAAKLAEIETAIENYFSSVPVGGQLVTATDGRVVLAEIYKAILTVENVVNFVPTAPTEDVSIDVDEVAVPSISITLSGV